MNVAKLQKLKSQAAQLLREHEALLTLSCLIATERAKLFERSREELALSGSVNKMQMYVQHEGQIVNELRHLLGTSVSNSQLLGSLDSMKAAASKMVEGGKKTHGFYIANFVLQRWFPNVGQLIPNFKDLPNHAKILIKIPPDFRPSFDWICPEVVLYEDMCALFNLAKEIESSGHVGGQERSNAKRLSAVIRSATSATVHFVSAYLNGIAVDFYIDNWKKLTDSEKIQLLEWDATRKKRVMVGLRTKVLKYPQILLGLANPPIDEANCPEFVLILSTAKQMRDAVAHASAVANPETLIPEKEMWLVNADSNQLTQAVDNAIALVRRIENAIRGNQKRLFWLGDRGSDGLFPPSVFY